MAKKAFLRVSTQEGGPGGPEGGSGTPEGPPGGLSRGQGPSTQKSGEKVDFFTRNH